MRAAILLVAALAAIAALFALYVCFGRAAPAERFALEMGTPDGRHEGPDSLVPSHLRGRDPHARYSEAAGEYYGLPPGLIAKRDGGKGPKVTVNGNTITVVYEDGTVVSTTCTEETLPDGAVKKTCVQVITSPDGEVTVIETTDVCYPETRTCTTTIKITYPDGTTKEAEVTTECDEAGNCETTGCVGDQEICDNLEGQPPRPAEWVDVPEPGTGGGPIYDPAPDPDPDPDIDPSCGPWGTPDGTESGYAVHADKEPCAFDTIGDAAFPPLEGSSFSPQCVAACDNNPDCHGMLVDAQGCTPYTIRDPSGYHRILTGNTTYRKISAEPPPAQPSDPGVSDPGGPGAPTPAECAPWPEYMNRIMQSDWAFDRHDDKQPCSYTAMGSTFEAQEGSSFVNDCRSACASDNACDGVLIEGSSCSMYTVADHAESYKALEGATTWRKAGAGGDACETRLTHNTDPSKCTNFEQVAATPPVLGQGVAVFQDYEPCNHRVIGFQGSGLVDDNYQGDVAGKSTLQISNADDTLACVAMCQTKPECEGVLIDTTHAGGGATCQMFVQDSQHERTIMPEQGSRTIYVKPVSGIDFSLMGGRRAGFGIGDEVIGGDQPHTKVWDQYDSIARVERLTHGGFASGHDYVFSLHGSGCSDETLLGMVIKNSAIHYLGNPPGVTDLVEARNFSGLRFRFDQGLFMPGDGFGLYDVIKLVMQDGRVVPTVAGPDKEGRLTKRDEAEDVALLPGYVGMVKGTKEQRSFTLTWRQAPDVADWHYGFISFTGFNSLDVPQPNQGEGGENALNTQLGLQMTYVEVTRNGDTMTWAPTTMSPETISWKSNNVILDMRIPKTDPDYTSEPTIVVGAGPTADDVTPLYKISLDPAMKSKVKLKMELRNFDGMCFTYHRNHGSDDAEADTLWEFGKSGDGDVILPADATDSKQYHDVISEVECETLCRDTNNCVRASMRLGDPNKCWMYGSGHTTIEDAEFKLYDRRAAEAKAGSAESSFSASTCLSMEDQMYDLDRTSKGVKIRMDDDHCVAADADRRLFMLDCKEDSTLWSQTPSDDGTFALTHRDTGRHLEVATDDSGAKHISLSDVPLSDPISNNRRWKMQNPDLEMAQERAVTLRNDVNGKCLDLVRKGDEPGKAILVGCNGERSQQFLVQGGIGRKVRLRSLEDLSRCVVINDQNQAVTGSCEDSYSQFDMRIAGADTFTLRHLSDRQTMLDVDHETLTVKGSVGAPVEGLDSQRWRVGGTEATVDPEPSPTAGVGNRLTHVRLTGELHHYHVSDSHDPPECATRCIEDQDCAASVFMPDNGTNKCYMYNKTDVYEKSRLLPTRHASTWVKGTDDLDIRVKADGEPVAFVAFADGTAHVFRHMHLHKIHRLHHMNQSFNLILRHPYFALCWNIWEDTFNEQGLNLVNDQGGDIRLQPNHVFWSHFAGQDHGDGWRSHQSGSDLDYIMITSWDNSDKFVGWQP